jgi:hypothetical protein
MSNLGYGYTRSQVMDLGTDLALYRGKRKKDDPPLSRTWFKFLNVLVLSIAEKLLAGRYAPINQNHISVGDG